MLTRHRILRDGFTTGLVGAAAVAVWFLIVDVIAGRPLFTPAVLGSFAFFGLRDAATVSVSVQPVVMYTLTHLLVFLFVGMVASVIIAEAEKEPRVLWLLAEFFIVFEVGFYAIVALFFTPLLAVLAWTNVAVGNLIAAVSMGYYLWRARPALRAVLRDQSPEDR
ncbi:MAG: hypothetical protein ACE5FJ_07605 [Gemmatimonadales bacterium]